MANILQKDFLSQMDALFEDGQSYVQVMKEMQDEIEEPSNKKKRIESSFNGKLMDFQNDGVKFLYNSYLCGMNSILGDDMGLGKTVQCLAFFSRLFDAGCLGQNIVICPSAVVYNWASEMEKFTPSIPCIVHHGDRDERRLFFDKMPKDFVLITSYHVYMNDASFFNRARYHVCVVDEAHRLKNFKCKLATLMDGLIVDDRILLTGTPLQNDIIELWSLLKFCLPKIFDRSFQVFEDWMNEIKNSKDDKLMFKMKKIIEPHMLRRTKVEVFPDMALKQSFLIFCPLTSLQTILYRAAESSSEDLRNLIEEYVKPLKGQVKTAFQRLRLGTHPMRELKICCHPFLYAPLDFKRPCSVFEASGKFCVLFQLLHKLRETGEKTIIFTQFVDIIDLIGDECESLGWEYSSLHGTTKLEDRQTEIEDFQKNDKIKIFIATTRSGGLGLNLTAANHVILFDIDWNPQVDKQGEDRAHRYGQSKPVKIYRLVTQNTVEHNKFDRAEFKLELHKKLLDEYEKEYTVIDAPYNYIDDDINYEQPLPEDSVNKLFDQFYYSRKNNFSLTASLPFM